MIFYISMFHAIFVFYLAILFSCTQQNVTEGMHVTAKSGLEEALQLLPWPLRTLALLLLPLRMQPSCKPGAML